MIKKIISFLSLCLFPCAVLGTGYDADNRTVVGWIGTKPSYVDANTTNRWNESPYNNIVKIYHTGEEWWGGTGSFISPKHILTNSHVADFCGGINGSDCAVLMSNGDNRIAKVVMYGTKRENDVDIHDGKDWSVLEIVDKNFCSNHYFGYKSPTVQESGLWRAGFGGLRVLNPTDISNMKKAYLLLLDDFQSSDDTDLVDYAKSAKNNMKNRGIKIGDEGSTVFTKFNEKFKEVTNGHDFENEYLYDGETLKQIVNCSVKQSDAKGYAYTSCIGYAGDSGSTVQNAKNQIRLLYNSGSRYILDKEVYAYGGVATQNIFTNKTLTEMLDAAKQSCANNNTSDAPADFTSERTFYNIGDYCRKADLPSNAIVGTYMEYNTKYKTKKLICNDSKYCSCIATSCENGYYLYVNSSGELLGTCYKSSCPAGTHLNIIDGNKTDGRCINDAPVYKIGDNCQAADLPEHATSGKYERYNSETKVKKLKCNGTDCACMATSCENGYYLYVNSSGELLGTCYKSTCPAGTHLNIIDGNKTDGRCINDEPVYKIGDNCQAADLPEHAMTGKYARYNSETKVKKLKCNGTDCACMATSCENGYYLYVNSSGELLGTCYKSSCPAGTHLNIIDGNKTDGRCINDAPVPPVFTPMPPSIDDNSNDIFREIDVYISKFEQDNEKDNTVQIVSDSIAGVVLGTVGGVVTSKIIKKNQAQDGFESLKCTIKGQDVATYGDVFQVGFRN